MFKQSRFFFSVSFIAVLFGSLLVLPKDVSAKSKRCPIDIPKPLLVLYLRSDLVVIADVASEKILKPEDENTNDENYLVVERNLDVVRSFKGQKMSEFSYSTTEYRPKIETENSEEFVIDGEYGADARPQQGKRYLFFFKKDEDGNFFMTDYISGAREITSENSLVLDKRLDELSKIAAVKKNQLPKITEWLVRLTEDAETRWDGANTLSRSFGSFDPEAEEEPQVFVLDKDFDEYSPAIAKQVSQAQKDRLSNIFIASLNSHFFGNAKNSEYDYTLAQLVGNWDKSRMAIYGFGILQSVDRKNFDKTSKAMNFIADMASDTELYDLYYQYDAVRNEAAEETSATVENESQNVINSEETAKTEEVVEKPVSFTGETAPENVREEIMQKFINRYQVLLARNFAPETEENKEVKFAEIIQ